MWSPRGPRDAQNYSCGEDKIDEWIKLDARYTSVHTCSSVSAALACSLSASTSASACSIWG